MYISILNKVVKIIKETIEKNGSHDRALRYTRNNLVKFTPEITLLNSLRGLLLVDELKFIPGWNFIPG